MKVIQGLLPLAISVHLKELESIPNLHELVIAHLHQLFVRLGIAGSVVEAAVREMLKAVGKAPFSTVEAPNPGILPACTARALATFHVWYVGCGASSHTPPLASLMVARILRLTDPALFVLLGIDHFPVWWADAVNAIDHLLIIVAHR